MSLRITSRRGALHVSDEFALLKLIESCTEDVVVHPTPGHSPNGAGPARQELDLRRWLHCWSSPRPVVGGRGR
jgi:hypothetical protein